MNEKNRSSVFQLTAINGLEDLRNPSLEFEVISPRLQSLELSHHLSNTLLGDRSHLAESPFSSVRSRVRPPSSEELLSEHIGPVRGILHWLKSANQFKVTRERANPVDATSPCLVFQVAASLARVIFLLIGPDLDRSPLELDHSLLAIGRPILRGEIVESKSKTTTTTRGRASIVSEEQRRDLERLGEDDLSFVGERLTSDRREVSRHYLFHGVALHITPRLSL
jgi:hypothetical protein